MTRRRSAARWPPSAAAARTATATNGATAKINVRVEDEIDSSVGYTARARVGQQVSAGEPLGLLYCRPGAHGEAAAARIRAAYTVGDAAPNHVPELIKEVIAQ